MNMQATIERSPLSPGGRGAGGEGAFTHGRGRRLCTCTQAPSPLTPLPPGERGIRWAALAAILTLSFPLVGRADEPAKSFTIPFDLIKTQHMVVSVKVNGK